MLDFDSARQRFLEVAVRVASEPLAVSAAAGRVLAEPLFAMRAVPEFDTSAMDGYAIHCDDAKSLPFRLPVVGEAPAGGAPARLQRATAMRIFTGAAMPEGGNAVVMQEHVDRDGLTISSNRAVAPGQHVRHRGEDLAASAMAVDRGQRLHPTTLALVSFLDRARVQVARAPKVTILCTGSELRRPGAPQRPFTIAESNSTTIALLAQQAGAVVHATRIIDDDQSRIEAAIVQALADSDVLVTIGGVSVGDYDFVRPALERADVVLDLYQVGIKPGKPITLGRRDNKVVVGLPGNPVSAVITFALFAMPLLRAMQGDRSAIPVPTWVPLGNPVKPDAKRTRVVLGNLIRHQTSSRFVAHANQTSGATIALGQTDGFVILEAALETAAAGTLQPFHRWTDL